MKTFYSLNIAFLVSVCVSANGQSSNNLWARSVKGEATSTGVCTDAGGNVYMTGNFNGPAISFGNITLTADSEAIFLVKYDSLGNVLWATSPANTGTGISNGISIDGDGNVYIAGGHAANYVWNDDNNVVPYGVGNVFIMKYDATGNLLWTKGSNAWGLANGISTDAQGDIFITGAFYSSSITFGSYTIQGPPSIFGANIFVVKYDASGNVQWVKSADALTDLVAGVGITADAEGNATVTGTFGGIAVLGGDSLQNNGGNMFIVRYDASGNMLWIKQPGQSADGVFSGITSDPFGNILITGYFFTPLIALGVDSLNLTGDNDIFTVKLDPSGNVLWAQTADLGNSELEARAYGVCTDAAGNVYVAGGFESPLITFGNTTLASVSMPYNNNMFIVKYDVDGNVIWAQSEGGKGDSYGLCPYVDANGDLYVSGSFTESMSFQGAVLTNDSLYHETFISKFGTNTIDTIIYPNLPITLYPNPSSGQFYFYGVKPGEKLDIYDLLGQRVYTSTIDQDNYEVSLELLAPKAVYLYRISTASSSPLQTGKIVIAKSYYYDPCPLCDE